METKHYKPLLNLEKIGEATFTFLRVCLTSLRPSKEKVVVSRGKCVYAKRVELCNEVYLNI